MVDNFVVLSVLLFLSPLSWFCDSLLRVEWCGWWVWFAATVFAPSHHGGTGVPCVLDVFAPFETLVRRGMGPLGPFVFAYFTFYEGFRLV